MDGLLFTLVARANGSHHSDGAELRSERTEHLIHKLILENDIQNRTSTLLLVAFNVAAAALVIASILYDAWKVSKRSPLKSEYVESLFSGNKEHDGNLSSRRYEFLRMIHPAEVVPLALTTAIVIQGIIFLGVQGAGLRGVRIRGCRSIDQVVFPCEYCLSRTSSSRQGFHDTDSTSCLDCRVCSLDFQLRNSLPEPPEEPVRTQGVVEYIHMPGGSPSHAAPHMGSIRSPESEKGQMPGQPAAVCCTVVGCCFWDKSPADHLLHYHWDDSGRAAPAYGGP